MKREEATRLLKDIIGVCDGINEQGVMLMPPDADDVLSHGYQLHIKMISTDSLSCIRPIVQKHNLVIAQETEEGVIVIYRPMEKEETVVQS